MYLKAKDTVTRFYHTLITAQESRIQSKGHQTYILELPGFRKSIATAVL